MSDIKISPEILTAYLKVREEFEQLCVQNPKLGTLEMMRVKKDKNEPPETARSRCSDCSLWSGHPGNRTGDLVCAVNPKIQPERQELEKVDGRVAYAWHDCQHFERAITPVFGRYSRR